MLQLQRAPAVTLEEWVAREEGAAWVEVSAGIHASLSPFSQWTPMEAACQTSCCIGSAGEMWIGSLWSLECGVVEVQCSALCLAHIGALLLHSILSCRVIDLLPAAYCTSCTESAQAAFYSQYKTSEIYAGWYIVYIYCTPLEEIAPSLWVTVSA